MLVDRYVSLVAFYFLVIPEWNMDSIFYVPLALAKPNHIQFFGIVAQTNHELL